MKWNIVKMGSRGNSTMIYLDNAATTPCEDSAAGLMLRLLTEEFGNPSSLHALGFRAERALERAAGQVSAALRCAPEELVFTSGATEANNLALCGAMDALRRKGNGLVISAAEHASVLETARRLGERGACVRVAPVRSDSTPDPEAVAGLVDEGTVLVSCMLVNNETGAESDVAAIAAAARRKNPRVLIHCDAVQALGKTLLDLRRLPVDLLSVSGHKIFGPKGVGALFVRKGVRLTPLLRGGHQQRGMRPGTENIPAIAGFGLACEAAAALLAARREHAGALCRILREGVLSIPGGRINSPPDAVPFILNVSLEGLRSETVLHFLEERGIYVSSGSACSKGAKSPVLAAMGLSPAVIDGALRLSVSHLVTPQDAQQAVDALREAAATLRRPRR